MTSRPLMARSDTRVDEDRQRRAVRERDKTCAFEVLRGSKWVRCGNKEALDLCHTYRRRDCAKAVFDADVAILGCRPHHDIYDDRLLGNERNELLGTVRVPPAVEERAWCAIVLASKVLPPRQHPDGTRI